MEFKGTCLNCGRDLKGLQTKFCGVTCKRNYYRTKRTEGAKVYKKTCAYCGKPFTTTNWRKDYCETSHVQAKYKEVWGWKGKPKPTEPEAESQKKPQISLNEAAKMARAQGKTYGELFQREVTVDFPWYRG